MLAHELKDLGLHKNMIEQREESRIASGVQGPHGTKGAHPLSLHGASDEEDNERIVVTVAEVCVNVCRTYIFAFLCLTVLALCMTGCGGHVGINTGGGGAINCGNCGSNGGGGGVGSGSNATVALTLLDPPTCASPRKTATHLFLSIAGVQVNPDAAATATSSGWVDVAPSLATAPKQLDLFNSSPFMGNLASASIAAGTYRSIKLLLAPNSASVGSNQCGTQGVNCVTTVASVLPIDVTAESTKGIVLNSASIAAGAISVTTDTNQNMNLLFDSCSSLISTGGGYRLLPNVIAWGGPIQTYTVTLTDAVTSARIGSGSGSAIVALEALTSSGVDRILAEGSPDTGGVVTLYGPQGTFDLVAVAQGVSGGASTMYSPLALTGVVGAGGASNFTMAMTSQGVAAPGAIQHAVTADAATDLRISVQQSATIAGVPTQLFTIPVIDELSATQIATATAGAGCILATCETGFVSVPSQPLVVQASGSAKQDVSTAPIAYTLFAEPFVQQGAGAKNCSTAPQGTSSDIFNNTLSPAPGMNSIATTLQFFGCN